MNTIKFAKKFAIPLFVALAYSPAQGLAVPLIGADLASFAVLGATSVTSAYPTFPSTIVGNVGVSTGTSITGFGTLTPLVANADTTGQVTGGTPSGLPIHPNDPLAISAHAQLLTTLGFLSGLAPILNLTGTDLGLVSTELAPLAPGVYKYDVAAGLTGTLELDASSPDAFWVFQVGSLLTVNANSSVVFIGDDGNKAPVFWRVADATLDTNANFIGNIAALTHITLADGANINCGSAWAYTANVTLINNDISTGCNNLEFTPPGVGEEGGGSVSVTPIPEPETYAMLLAGLGVMGFVARRRQRNLAAAA